MGKNDERMDKSHKRVDNSDIGQEILFSARNELYLNFHYLDAALCALPFQEGQTLSIATDGQTFFYHTAFLSERFLRSPTLVNRAYLHLVFHAMLRHIAKKRGKIPELWDLACDAAVESILDSLEKPCLSAPNTQFSPARRKFYGECSREMKVLTAEGIYRHLLRQNPSEYELSTLSRLFLADDHALWNPEQQRSEQQDQNWKAISEKTRTAMETVLAGQVSGNSQTILEQVKAAVRDDVDYRAFLRRFAVPKEILSLDADSFDYGFYSYGLRLYGNLPLVEPLETRVETRIEDFVIALDTSMSTSGEQIRLFLASTYAILRSTATFTRKVHIRILQCDDQIRSDRILHDLDGLRELMDHFTLSGGSATDFRPVFEHVNQLQKNGAFSRLRGLIYFTDGMGIYPVKRPPYETAFILNQEPPMSVVMPPWAIRLVLTPPELQRAAQEASELPDAMPLDELPQL